jgi:protein associated with RNAse G/E
VTLKSISEVKLGERITIEEHKVDGEYHREDGPAWTLRTNDGLVVEFNFRSGRLDGREQPAITVRYDKCSVYCDRGVSDQTNPPSRK